MMHPVEPTSDLRLLLVSRHPLLAVRVDDEMRFLGVLRRAATDANMALWTWSAARGLARDGMPPQPATADITQALGFAGELRDPAVFVFLDAKAALADATVVRRLKEFALGGAAGADRRAHRSPIWPCRPNSTASPCRGRSIHPAPRKWRNSCGA